jgi:hypothetical protein
MTDRELLELAAKAACIEIECDADKAVVFPSHYSGGFSIINDAGGSSLWNPLTDDCDALRLAVKLEIHITNDRVTAWASTFKYNATEPWRPLRGNPSSNRACCGNDRRRMK